MSIRVASCNWCGGTTLMSFLHSGFDPIANLLICQDCGLVCTETLPDDKTLAGYYEDSYYRPKSAARFFSPVEWIVHLFRYFRAHTIERQRKMKGSILDIGCGRGIMLALLKRHHWIVEGTQLSRTAIEAARIQYGLVIRYGELAPQRFPDSCFDVVTMWHVLEHVRDPRSYFFEVARIIKPGGLLIIEVPNIMSLGACWFKYAWFALDAPYHLYHFSPSWMRAACASAGFRIVRERYFSLEYSPFVVLQSILNWMLRGNNDLFLALSSANALDMTWRAVVSFPLAIIFALPSLAISLFFGALGRGDIMTWYVVRE